MTILFMGGILSGQMRTASDGTVRLLHLHFDHSRPGYTCQSEYSDTGEKTQCCASIFEFCWKHPIGDPVPRREEDDSD